MTEHDGGQLPGRRSSSPVATSVGAPVASQSPPSAPLRLFWSGMSRTAQALGWRRFLAPDAVAAVACLTRPRRVAACAARHRRADPSLTATGARVRARASYREYFRTCVDLAWAHDLEVEAVRRLHPIDGFENIDRARQEHGAGIFCLAHFGNWDMAATMALSHGLAVTTVMREFRPASLNRLIVWARERRGLEVFTPGRAARGLLHALRRGRFLALLADIPEGGPTVEVRFRGGPVLFSTGPAAMALRSGCPLLPCACYRDGRHYRILVEPPIPTGTIPEMTQALAERLDALIALAPDQWYPFNPLWTDER
ncbi:MAG: lysophospholipid acyltransferase family protein [Candidatus Dormibacteria bacterium]